MVRISEHSDGMEYLVFINRETMEKECKRLFNCKVDHLATEIIHEPFDIKRLAPHISLGGACVLFVVISFTCYYITHGKVKRAMIQKQRQEYLEYLEEMQDSEPDLRKFHKGPRMAPGYPSLFLPKCVMSTMYNPAELKCSPSHDTLSKRIKNRKSEENKENNRAFIGRMIQVSDKQDTGVDKWDITKKHTCKCACGNEFTNRDQTGISANAIEITAAERNEKNYKGKGKKSQNVPDACTASIKDDKNKSEIVQRSIEYATADRDEVSSNNSQDATKSEESGIFDEHVKVNTEGRQIEDTRNKATKPTPVPKVQKITNYIGKSCKTKRQDEILGHGTVLSCSSNNYIIEVEDETTDNSSCLSSDNDNDDMNETREMQDRRVYRKSTSSKTKHKKVSRVREKKSNVNFHKDDYDLRKLVINAEDIDHGYSESGDDALYGLNGNVKTRDEIKDTEKYRAMRRRSISENNLMRMHHPISSLYYPAQRYQATMPTIEISSADNGFLHKERKSSQSTTATMPFVS